MSLLHRHALRTWRRIFRHEIQKLLDMYSIRGINCCTVFFCSPQDINKILARIFCHNCILRLSPSVAYCDCCSKDSVACPLDPSYMFTLKAPVKSDSGYPLPDQVEDKFCTDDNEKKCAEKNCHSRTGENPDGVWNSLPHATGAFEITGFSDYLRLYC